MRRLISAAGFNLVIFLLATTTQAQIALHDGGALAIPRVITGGTAISSSFTVTAGAGVMVGCLPFAFPNQGLVSSIIGQ